MAVILDVIFALSEGIPELDGSVTGPRDDLSVISAEADGKDVRRMADESTRCLPGVKVPKTKSVIPRCGEGELAIGGDDNIGDKMVVTVQNTFWIAVRILFTGQLPDDDSLVCVQYG